MFLHILCTLDFNEKSKNLANFWQFRYTFSQGRPLITMPKILSDKKKIIGNLYKMY